MGVRDVATPSSNIDKAVHGHSDAWKDWTLSNMGCCASKQALPATEPRNVYAVAENPGFVAVPAASNAELIASKQLVAKLRLEAQAQRAEAEATVRGERSAAPAAACPGCFVTLLQSTP